MGRWWLGCVAAISICGGTIGCHKSFCRSEAIYWDTLANERSPSCFCETPPLATDHIESTPRTVEQPEGREKWNLTLEDTIRLALQNNREIAVMGFDPGQSGTQIETALSAFDTYVSAGTSYQHDFQQIYDFLQSLGSPSRSITLDTSGMVQGSGNYGYVSTSGGATQNTFTPTAGVDLFSLQKRNATGGLTTFSYDLNYYYQNPISQVLTAINPGIQTAVSLGVQQPLLQGAGVQFNRAPVMIARANYQQAIFQFQSEVADLLQTVEKNYWNLYLSYQNLYAAEVGMETALATWQNAYQGRIAGTTNPSDEAQARDQYQSYRAMRVQAVLAVLDAERTLRKSMGISLDDGRQIVTADDPVQAEYKPDWNVGLTEGMQLRPELAAQRFAIRAAELQVMRQRNGLLPDLTLSANYMVTGLNDSVGEATEDMGSFAYNTVYVGLRMQRQIGERAAHAAVRNAQLALSQQRATLQQQEYDIRDELLEAYQNVTGQYQVMLAQQERRRAAAEIVRIQQRYYQQGTITINILLEAQQTFAEALSAEAQAVVDYNNALVSWEYSRGTIFGNDNVAVLEQFVNCDPRCLDMGKRFGRQRGEQINIDYRCEAAVPLDESLTESMAATAEGQMAPAATAEGRMLPPATAEGLGDDQFVELPTVSDQLPTAPALPNTLVPAGVKLPMIPTAIIHPNESRDSDSSGSPLPQLAPPPGIDAQSTVPEGNTP